VHQRTFDTLSVFIPSSPIPSIRETRENMLAPAPKKGARPEWADVLDTGHRNKDLDDKEKGKGSVNGARIWIIAL
jgi:hypothetical protein